MQIIPAILEKDLKSFSKKLSVLAHHFNRFHIDVIDESFGNRNLRIEELFKLRDEFFIETHLMVKRPELMIGEIKRNNIDLVFGQIERIENFDTYLSSCEKADIQCGVAVDLETPIEKYEREISGINKFLLMAVKAGKSGQEFDDRVLDKIKLVRQISGDNAEILVDGGINLKTARKCKDAGVSGVLVNSFLWENFENNLYQLKLLS